MLEEHPIPDRIDLHVHEPHEGWTYHVGTVIFVGLTLEEARRRIDDLWQDFTAAEPESDEEFPVFLGRADPETFHPAAGNHQHTVSWRDAKSGGDPPASGPDEEAQP